MTDNGKFRDLVVAALMAALLAACSAPGGSSDDKMGRFLVAPDKFILYTCPQLAERATVVAAREKELQGLMARAGPSTDGRLVSAVAYEPEYLELRGETNEVRNAAAAKNCKSAPGAVNSGGRASDNAVR